ncbi:hypothetical protein [Lacipirellula parvula]|uniref:Uncharacterized protein n=1 Tax=Lacipirellula parvula TaxID=2650471 RepID=A0A5K7XAU5_9BACT|nr:hypothetical protein [Lacipirellula parvula]BBO33658.1 hypothetical protein PLANPX_3270 [Lacipirellula parvula]
MSNTSCLRCHGTNFQAGSLQTAGQLHFLPQVPGLLNFLGVGSVKVESRLCMDCGTLDFTVDPAEVAERNGLNAAN